MLESPARAEEPATPATAEVQAAARSLATAIERLSHSFCPQETPAIVANAENDPVDHFARRRRPAETRDTFDKSILTAQ